MKLQIFRKTIQAVLGDELNAWYHAVSQGLVMVWSAGNDGADDVSRASQVWQIISVKRHLMCLMVVAGQSNKEIARVHGL